MRHVADGLARREPDADREGHAASQRRTGNGPNIREEAGDSAVNP